MKTRFPKTKLILGTLEKSARTADFLLNIFLGGNIYRQLRRHALYPTMPDFSSGKKQVLKKEQNNLYSLLSKLEKQGFIKKKQEENKNCWIITILGKQHFKKLKTRFHSSKKIYKKEKDKGWNLFIFDIPEKEKAKRNWLRGILINLGFVILQKSVWIGSNKLPKEFLKDLEELGIIKFVHVFRVSRSGTLDEKRINEILEKR